MFAPPPPVAALHSPAAMTPVRYGFDGAQLGMDFTTWRASPSAEGAVCDQGSSTATQVCTLPAPDIGGGYLAHDLTFSFVDSQLAAIAFRTSIDGFNYATAALKRRFGEPGQMVRGDLKGVDGAILPHVAMVWRNGRSTIRLSDPMTSRLALSVRLSLDADAPRLPKPPS